MSSTLSRLCVCFIALAVTPALQGQPQEAPKFRSGIDLISVTATVTMLEDVSHASGDTALYDAIALALPTAQERRHVKEALLVISDGNDSRSLVTLPELRQAIVESDVLVASSIHSVTRRPCLGMAGSMNCEWKSAIVA